MARWRMNTAWLGALALVIAACGGTGESDDTAGATTTQAPPTSSEEPIVIGIAAGFTGVLESLDTAAALGAEIAVDEINAAGGILGRQVEIVTADTQSDVNQGARAGQEVIQDGADVMLVTPDFNFGGGAAREAQSAGMVVISMGAGSPKFGVEGIGDLAFTMGISGVTDGAVSAEWAYEEQEHRTAWLLIDDVTDYNKDQCRGFSERFTELGGEILGSDTFKNSDPSVAPQVSRISALAEEPDIISLCSFPPGGAVAVKQIRDAGITADIVSNGAMDGDYWFSETMPNLSGFYFLTSASIWGNDPSDEVNAFVESYTAAAGSPPQQIFAFFGYAAVKALQVAIERAGTTDGQAVASALESFDKENIVGIEVSFTEELHIDTQRSERIIRVENGVHEVVSVRANEKSPSLFEE